MAFAGILEQPVLPDTGDQDVGKSIVVVVADGDTHPIHLNCESSSLGDIRERPVAVVTIQPRRGALLFVAGPIHSIDKEYVQPAVAVVIEKSASGPQRLGQVLRAE